MIAWWWLIPTILISTAWGALIMALCSANNRGARNRWWEE